MKAEDFLKRNHHTFCVMSDGNNYTQSEEVYLHVALASVDKARSEERSKALSCFEAVLTEAIIRQSEGVHVELCTLKEQFKGLINK